ncbi:hypothetical protein [Zunongwangia sp. HGR-M22]|uniref:hypothetical protein n=1 Tax=Zunongwangia sp. HGR-M22 TaxID=3015168 RepID=UPI0022DD3476|nr:hypothetical protein [Zunongwangia sp. HGR-M22]WBL24140.1 hypothetical protein PBT91_09365 [Zunongwangia sp. HGR-M22]
MKTIIKIFTVLAILICCISAANKIDYSTEKVDYGKMIEVYLQTKKIEPTIVFDNDKRNKINLLEHKFSWRNLEKGIEIIVDGHAFTTSNKMTSNIVWDSGVENVNFANFLQQIKIYKDESIIGFVLINKPCTGLGCSINYQIIYNLKTKKQTYFGRFRSGFEFELYNFNSDNQTDFLSKTFYGRNAQGIDTTEFVLYSQTQKGDFKKFETEEQKKFWFKHTYTEFQLNLDNDKFEENWIEKINKNGR